MLLEFIRLDFPPLLMLMLTALMCSIAGNYVILTKRSLASDMIAHSVLPGIVLGFLIGGSLTSIWVSVGAMVSAGIAIFFGEYGIKKIPVEPNAILGAVFSVMFALGLVFLELFVGSQVHLDVDHVLFGGLEQIIWLDINSLADLFLWSTWLTFPAVIVHGVVLLCLLLCVITVTRKPLVMTMFDREHAALCGFYPGVLHALAMISLVLTVVFAFQAVGSVLVLALLICPGGLMRLYGGSLRVQFIGSALFAVLLSIAGYSISVFVPIMIGLEHTFSVAGSVGSLAFLCFLIGALLPITKESALQNGNTERNH